MNIEDYISSGIVEAYVLGELDERERAEFERNLLLYPKLRDELSKVEETNERLLMSNAVAPRAEVKAKLFAQIAAPDTSAMVIPISKEQTPVWKYAAAASITLAIISSYLAFTYWSKWKATSSQLTELIAQNQQLAENYNRVELDLDKLAHELKVMNNPAFHKVTMSGTPNAPGALASVYWNSTTSEVYLRIHNLKSLTQEQQYQLWAIVDGKPVDAGVFDAGSDALLKMKTISSGAVKFAVTIEPRGGKPAPTLETMQMIGDVI